MYGFVITDKGRDYLAKAVMGGKLEITRIVMDKGTVADEVKARSLSAVIDQGPEGVSTVPTQNENCIQMVVEYRSDLNGGLKEGFWIGGFGLFARISDSEEIMFGYASLGEAKQYVSPWSPGAAPDIRRYPVSIPVTTELEIAVSYPPKAWMTAADVKNLFDNTLYPKLLTEMKNEIEGRAAPTLLGPASLVELLLPGGLLLVTDDADPEDYTVTLDNLLAEGDKAARGEADALGELLTVGRTKVLNLRSDAKGSYYTADNLSALAVAIRGMCADAQAGGIYVTDGVTVLSYRQAQYYVLHGTLVSQAVASAETWTWAKDPASEVAALREEVAALGATIGDINSILDTVNGGGGT